MRKRKKTKAQREYERIRKNIREYSRYHQSDIVLPLTPRQEKGKDIKATDYRKATGELKRFYAQLKGYIKQRDTVSEEDYSTVADVIINNFLEILQGYPKSNGRLILNEWVNSLLTTYKKFQVADMLLQAQQSGYVVTREIMYSDEQTYNLIQNMRPFLKTSMNKKDYEELIDLSEEFERYENV